MTRTHRRLELALFVSLILHLLPFVPGLADLRPPRPSAPPPLDAQLRLPPSPTPQLTIPEPTSEPARQLKPPPPQKAPPAASPTPRWENVVRKQLQQLKASGLYYSQESFALGLQGNVSVLFVVDSDGNVTAARVEESSGQPLLDRDAVTAVKRLRGLPADTPREGILPLRFRLKD